MPEVLITGAHGFIGSRLVKEFLNRGLSVECWSTRPGIIHGITAKIVNFTDMGGWHEDLLNECSPDIIIHCAGRADVRSSIKSPSSDYRDNVTVTHSLLFTLHKLNLKNTRFIFLSSAAVYGNPSSLPIREDAPVRPMSPYAVHKAMCEQLCMYFIRNYGMDIKIARIFSAYGAGLRKQIFWDMYNRQRETGRLDMFGTGRESRDYIHADDVAQAIYLLSVKDSPESIFNVANGEEVTIREAAEIFAECAGLGKNNIRFNGIIREGDPLNWRADITKISELGYRKTVDMKAGLKGYFLWAEEHSGGGTEQ